LRFAAAIGNEELGNLVIQQLREPISRNTYNAVANFYISFGQWEEAEGIFNLLIEYRKKAWGETTLATLTATILRLEQRVWEEPWDEELETSLLRAQTMLRKFLWGRYNPEKVYNESVNLYYKQTIYRWHSLLSSIPGAVARVANDVKPAYTNPLKRDKFSFIPSRAFNILLSAVVETRGSQLGMQLWEKWCIDIERSHAARLAVDEKYRLQMSADPTNTDNLDIEYDWAWHYERQRKAVNPNLNTLRIISRAAVKELKESQKAAPDRRNMSPSQQKFREQVYEVLDFCVDRYQRFNRDKDEIGRETGGHLRRIRMWQSRKRKNIVRWVYGDLGEEDNTGMKDLLAETEDEEKEEVY
jgi:pentatricopeptide repeat protein